MKISILTATYNRANYLTKVYESIVKNTNDEMQAEWLIMDDGSIDNTKEIVEKFNENRNLTIKYFYQENQGKMKAINNLINYVQGDLILECDSDDWLAENAFETINKAYEDNKNRTDLYALCFFHTFSDGKNMGKDFKIEETTMFDLYFKQGEDGEKALVFFSSVRKQYEHVLEKDEKFVTEARLYHKMDLKYKIRCYNQPVLVGEYQEDGYSKNITKIFIDNPKGYFEYFREIFEHDMSGVPLKKRLYVIKHYIVFATLTKQKNIIKKSKGLLNRFLILILYIPGKFATKKRFKNRRKK